MAGRSAVAVLAILFAVAAAPPQQTATPAMPADHAMFAESTQCIGCHNGLSTPSGEDVSIGTWWRASMMANAARDPYWQAAVRREITDHPTVAAAIENECSACHMPMAHVVAKRQGTMQGVMAHLGDVAAEHPATPHALDGVSCAVCHQIEPVGRIGREHFNAGFNVASQPALGGGRSVYGPFEIKPGHVRIMESATGFTPQKAAHTATSDVCASCHTLFTHAFNADGGVAGELPEQTPYLEWRHSAFAREERHCQSCHMPAVEEPVQIANVLGEPREGVSRHRFRGGNFFMPAILNRHRAELGVTATATELDRVAFRTREHLASSAATLAVSEPRRENGRLVFDVAVSNLAGHKLPTAYPSRRAWIHLRVSDATGAAIFESGALRRDGSIAGNVNDADGAKYEPHYETIDSPSQVQIYETILGAPDGSVTTGLLTATKYLKDNRVLPRGFDAKSAASEIAIYGGAAEDGDFVAGGDTVRFAVDTGDAPGPFRVEAALMYQPIGFRWAENLRATDAMETQRFVRYYEEAAAASAAVLARGARSGE
jgi:hypothetical protein